MGGEVRMGGIAAAPPPERVAVRGAPRKGGAATTHSPPSNLPATPFRSPTHTHSLLLEVFLGFRERPGRPR